MTGPLAPSELKALFLDEVPEPVILDTARCIIGSYDEAFRFCRSNFPGPEAHDLYPIIRRSMFERNWRARLSRYKIDLVPTPNAIGNCFHTELRLDRVIITVSAVESPGDIVREAVFRKGLAQDNQLNLFFEAEPPPEDASLYAIVLHGPAAAGLLPSPGFIRIAFPARDCDKYVDSFNLLDHFPILQTEIDKLPKVEIQRKKPRLRREQDRKAE
jgi:hypothetical protein